MADSQFQSPLRAGAALIMAMVILAALMLLGLPFLFSQSSSLSGSRALAQRQGSAIARDTAEGFAIGRVADRMERFYGDQQQHVYLPADLKDAATLPDQPPNVVMESPTRMGFAQWDLEQRSLNRYGSSRDATIGVSIEDESGKFDPNSLGPAGWANLLHAVGIVDWDDDATADSQYVTHSNNPSKWHEGDDSDDFGELAEELARLRVQRVRQGAGDTGPFVLAGGRYTHLEQLMLADPGAAYSLSDIRERGESGRWNGHNLGLGQGYDDVANKTWSSSPSGRFGLRRPLTRIEIELLRPHLGFHNQAQAREGIVDLGTVVWRDRVPSASAVNPGDWHYFVDGLDEYNRDRTWVLGTVIGSQKTIGQRDRLLIERRPSGSEGSSIAQIYDGQIPAFAEAETPLAIEVQAPININAASSMTKEALFGHALGSAPYRTLAALGAEAYRTPNGTNRNLFQHLDPLFTTDRELPPIDIASRGVISIDAAGSVTDPLGRLATIKGRHSVAQAVPQETILERHWLTQAQMHAQIAQRHVSRMMSWPYPINRLLPLDATWIQQLDVTTGHAAGPASLSAAPLPTLASMKRSPPPNSKFSDFCHVSWHWDISGADWRSATTGNGQQALAPGIPSPLETNLRPDGLFIDSNAGNALAFPLTNATANGDVLSPRMNGDDSTGEMKGRHISMWVKPEADWDGKIIPIFETRMDPDRVGQYIDPTSSMDSARRSDGSIHEQNYLGLFYDGTGPRKFLVAVIAPPSIEHPTNIGPDIPPDIVDQPTSWEIDERSHGDNDPLAEPLAPAQQKSWWSGATFNPSNNNLHKLTKLFTPNRIVQLYDVTGKDGKSWIAKDRSAHVRLCIGNDLPGGMQITVDDYVGRDLGKGPLDDFTAFGDHFTFAGLPLAASSSNLLKYEPTPGINGTHLRQADSITVRSIAGVTAEDLFPARGALRVGDEYLTYEKVSGTTFTGCVRGYRQNTQSDDTIPDNRYPVLQSHGKDALVIPGGYRLTLSGPGQFYRGGCTLVEPLKSGAPRAASPPVPNDITNAHPTYIWATLDIKALPVVPIGGDNYYRFDFNVTKTISLIADRGGVPHHFPPRGVIKFDGQYYYYRTSGSALELVPYFQHFDLSNDLKPAYGTAPNNYVNLYNTSIRVFNWPVTQVNSRAIYEPVFLVSLELSPDVDVWQDGRYKISDTPGLNDDVGKLTSGHPYFYMQLLHHTNGRVEWIAYMQIAKKNGEQYLIQPSGWHWTNQKNNGLVIASTRGLQRTDFAGKTNSSLYPDTDEAAFPSGTKVIPVQTEMGTPGHWIGTGDVVTLLPAPSTLPIQPVQLVVRFAPVDGFSDNPNDPMAYAYDTKNEYFSFTDFLPTGILPDVVLIRDYEWLVGNCASARDLTAKTSQDHPRGYLPRLDRLAEGRFHIASIDDRAERRDRSSGSAAVLHQSLSGGVQPVADATIDGMVAGDLDGAGWPSFPGRRGIVGFSTDPDNPDRGTGSQLSAAPLSAPVAIFSDDHDPIFQSRPMGLVLIDGEVFAFRKMSDTKAWLIGRGLLGTTMTEHVIGQGRDNSRIATLNAIFLPIGPVAQLADQVTNGVWFQLTHSQPVKPSGQGHRGVHFSAPLAMFAKPDGSAYEIIQLVGPHEKDHEPGPNDTRPICYTTAGWARGLYGSRSATWGGIRNNANALSDLVIGRWPRYPSALPPASNCTTQHLRSRTYPWIGYAFCLHDARFDLLRNDVATISDASSNAAKDLFDVQVRALASGFDWVTGIPAASLASPNAAFTGSQFSGQATGGAEMRITWHYNNSAIPDTANPLPDIARNGSCTPRIGAVRLRCYAPAKILSSEEAR